VGSSTIILEHNSNYCGQLESCCFNMCVEQVLWTLAVEWCIKCNNHNELKVSTRHHVILDSTLDDEIGGYLDVELIKLPKNIKRQVISVLDPFLSFLGRFEPKKVHNMLCLMLDPWYKNLCFVSSFIERDIGKLIVNEYDEKSLLVMLLKCYEHSHQISWTPNNS
jgi:hypothetical protein